jgi:sterol desaturase/sphingolipid hydroxylase (fatty acid hydroxylase superfamily)
MLEIFSLFMLWSYAIYWMHRLVHVLPYAKHFHCDHHAYIIKHGTDWHWNNLFLFNDTWKSTVDLWITEVIPTILFCLITGQWWILLFYYIWAAFIQERIEHNSKFDWYPWLTSGKWHLVHHRKPRKNFGLFIPLWDILHGTRELATQ